MYSSELADDKTKLISKIKRYYHTTDITPVSHMVQLRERLLYLSTLSFQVQPNLSIPICTVSKRKLAVTAFDILVQASTRGLPRRQAGYVSDKKVHCIYYTKCRRF